MTHSRAFIKTVICFIGITALSLGVSAAAVGTPKTHAAAVWKLNAVVASGTQLLGPFLAQSESGKFLAEYAIDSGSGAKTKTSLVWRSLIRGKWSRPVTAATNVLAPRAFEPSFAASDTRVATFSASYQKGKDAPKLNFIEQTTTGSRAFSRDFGYGYGMTVALDQHNTATTLYSAYAHNKYTLYARQISSTGHASKPVALQKPATEQQQPVVVDTGAGRSVAAWLVPAGKSDGYNTDTIRTASFANGKWHKYTNLNPTDKAVLYLGMSSRGSSALLTYTDQLPSGNTKTRALPYASGKWGRPQTIAKNVSAGPWRQSLSTAGQAEFTDGRAYVRSPKSSIWRRGPGVPTFNEYCGGSFEPSAYQGKTLHWFVITPKGKSSADCTLSDYTLG